MNASYSIFKSVIGVDESGDCILNAPRDKIQYRIVIKNEGNVNLYQCESILIPVIKPYRLQLGTIMNEGELNPGEIWVYTGNYTVTQDDINNKQFINNTATVNSNELPEKSSSVSQPIATKGRFVYI